MDAVKPAREGVRPLSILELCLKLLDGVTKLIGILTGINTLLTARKQARDKKNHRE